MAIDVGILTRPLPRQTPPPELITFDEFCTIIREDQKADLINGVIYMAAPPTFEHEDLFGFLLMLLRGYVREKKIGHVLGSRAAMKLSEIDAPEPDIMFISNAKLPQSKGKALEGPADLVIELVSPGSRRLDLMEKKELYAKFGVREYWVIDAFRQTASFWKNSGGSWKDIPLDHMGVVRSTVIPGFWLRVDWLFAQEFPGEREIIALILAGDPADLYKAS